MLARLALAARVAAAARPRRLRRRGAVGLVRPQALRRRRGRRLRRDPAGRVESAHDLDHRSASSCCCSSRPSLLYNRLVSLRNRVENAWAQVDVQLKRRYDLIPNLVETVKGYAAHERETFEAVTAARTRAQQAQGPAEQGAAEGILGQALGRLFAVAEAYPELQARRELPAAPGRARADREPDRGLAPGLQRHRPHLQHRDPAGPGQPRRRAVRLHAQGVLRGGGRGPGGATRRVLAAGALGGARARRRRRREVVLRCRPRTSPSRSQQDGVADRRRGDRVRVRRRLQRRLPRHPAPRRRVARPGLGREGDRSTARAAAPSSAASGAPGTFGTTRTDDGMRIVWHYSARQRAARVPRPLPAARRRRRLRRRRRRQPAGLGRRVGGRPRPADRRRSSRPATCCAPGDIPSACAATSRSTAARVDLRARRHSGRPVRRAARARPAPILHLDGGHEGRGRARASRRSSPRSARTPRAFEHDQRKIDDALDNLGAHDRDAARARALPALALLALRLVALRARARDRLRPRVRAGAADRDAARARAGAARAGRRAGLARVHCDALRPDPPRPLPRRAR